VRIEGFHTKHGRSSNLPRRPIRDRVKEVIGYFWRKFLAENKYSIYSEEGTIKISNSTKHKVKRRPLRETVYAIIKQLRDDGGRENLIEGRLMQLRGSEIGVYHWLHAKLIAMARSTNTKITLAEFKSYSSLLQFQLPRESNASAAIAGFYELLGQIQRITSDHQPQMNGNIKEHDTEHEWLNLLAQTPELDATIAGFGRLEGTGRTPDPVTVKCLVIVDPWRRKTSNLQEKVLTRSMKQKKRVPRTKKKPNNIDDEMVDTSSAFQVQWTPDAAALLLRVKRLF